MGTLAAKRATAGGGPENVFVVVNSASWASQAVANQFVQLRHIPPNNVFYIDWDGGFEGIEVEAFRQKILAPVLTNIDLRKLGDQIDYIVYSSDFPYDVNLSGDLGGQQTAPQLTPNASISSATYMWQSLFTRNGALIGVRTNAYMRAAEGRKVDSPSHGFRSWYGWGPKGELLEAGGQRYMLSTMLGMTSGRGNSVGEVIRYLRRAAEADGTRPKGTIYYMRNDDVRSTVRAGGFPDAAEELEKLGVAAQVLPGVLPPSRPDVQGAMTGIAEFNWVGSGSTIRAGAIVENFTSLGGMLTEEAPQTPLTEFLRQGAAGSSGTIIEPYAIQDKFPVPAMQVHYARGCSLAESYYQSVFGPFQLLIVGDPLCRPWANIAKVHVDGVKAKDTLKGQVVLKPAAELPHEGSVAHFELFVDGRRTARCDAAAELELDTTVLPDGFHELRIVAIEAGPIESQGRLILPVMVDNQGRSIEFSTSPEKMVRWDQKLVLKAKSPKSAAIGFFHNGRLLGRATGENGEIEISPKLLGSGTVVLQAFGLAMGGPQDQVAATPITLHVHPSAPLPALRQPAPNKLIRGMLLRAGGGKAIPVQTTRDPAWPSVAGLKPKQAYELEGYFDVPVDDIYQFQVWHHGDLRIVVDNSTIYDGKLGRYNQRFAPVSLSAGLHRLRLQGTSGAQTELRILFGGPGALSLNGALFRHTD